jgi:hypothetical protein
MPDQKTAIHGAYCEHHEGHVLVWGPRGYIGSAHNPQELWGLLQRLSEYPHRVPETYETKWTRMSLAPSLPADHDERQRAIADHIAREGVTRPANHQPKRSDTRKRAPAISVDDLNLDLE